MEETAVRRQVCCDVRQDTRSTRGKPDIPENENSFAIRFFYACIALSTGGSISFPLVIVSIQD